ncbi:MAG: SpaA isopeptide-forming pilin-related protein [Pyrinomonadaceae bacterium]
MSILFAVEASACSCAGTPAPCQEYWQTPVVFAGTVTYSSKASSNQENYQWPRRLVRFTIDEAFRGVDGVEVDVMTGFSDADCGYGFRLGGQYLVYADRQEDGRLTTSICTRTRPLSDAKEDLAYIRGLATAKTGATIFGEVRSNKRGLNYESRPGLLAGAKIIVKGPAKRIETTTDKNGKYKVSDLPGDTYKVRIEPPAGFTIRKAEIEVKVSDRGCAEVGFWLEPDTRISGRVLDSQGQPAADVLMEPLEVKVSENSEVIRMVLRSQ